MSAIDAPGEGPGSNTGHGHVWKRPDRAIARCGGPRLCKRCQADQAAYPEPSLVDNKPPIFTDHGDRIEISWPFGRGLFWTTPDAVEGWAAGVNEVRAERNRLRDALKGILDLIGPDSFCSCEECEDEQPARERALAAAQALLSPPLHPTRRDLARMEGP